MGKAIVSIAVAALIAALPPAAAAQSASQRLVVPLSDPTRPATLEVSLVMGSISVTAYDGNEIVIVAGDDDDDEDGDDSDFDFDFDFDGPGDDDGDRPSREGLHRIPNTSIGLTAEERNNTVTVAVDWSNRDIDLAISVPRNTSVRAATVNGGDLEVQGVSGEHELSNVNGDVSAVDIAGSAVVSTTNGDVEVSFTEITPNKAMSFTSFNGDVEVSFPPSLAANLRINAGRGEVLTDFDVVVQQQPAVVERSRDAEAYRVRLEREVRAIVGGGGPELRFQTFNGDVIIRRR